MSSEKRKADSLLDEGNDETPAGGEKKQRTVLTYDSDDDIPEESIDDHLSWREDHSYSDWTIVIVVKDEPRNASGGKSEHHDEDGNNNGATETLNNKGEKDTPEKNADEEAKSRKESTDNDINSKAKRQIKEYTYHVHKHHLAIGPRHSEYFAGLFEHEGSFPESQSKTSRIELPELAAKAFPEFLDYMYTVGQKMKFTTGNATALYYLSKYFVVPRLRHDVKKFCLEDMRRSETCGIYYQQAKVLQEHAILEAVTKFCRENVQDLRAHWSLLRATDVQFWLDLMLERRGTIPLQLSIIIVQFCRTKKVSLEEFKQLTDEQYLGDAHIHPAAAVYFLEMEHKLSGQAGNRQEGGVVMSSLQKRCVEAIILRKELLARFREGDWDRHLQNISPFVLGKIITGLVRVPSQPQA